MSAAPIPDKPDYHVLTPRRPGYGGVPGRASGEGQSRGSCGRGGAVPDFKTYAQR
jgi:hypothetical protein